MILSKLFSKDVLPSHSVIASLGKKTRDTKDERQDEIFKAIAFDDSER